MRTFKFALLATCILNSTAFADCPKAEVVKKALMEIIHFDQLPTLMEAALNDSKIDKKEGISLWDFDPNQPMTLKSTQSSGGDLFCVYSVQRKEIVRFYVKK